MSVSSKVKDFLESDFESTKLTSNEQYSILCAFGLVMINCYNQCISSRAFVRLHAITVVKYVRTVRSEQCRPTNESGPAAASRGTPRGIPDTGSESERERRWIA